MKVDLEHHDQLGNQAHFYGSTYNSQIKSQHEIQNQSSARAIVKTSTQTGGGTKRAHTSNIARRQRKNMNTFDIQVRSFNYKGVPEPSDIQLAKKATMMKKAARDKVSKQKQVAGCSLFKYRNNKAFYFEREQLQRGVTVRDGNFNTQVPYVNSALQTNALSLKTGEQGDMLQQSQVMIESQIGTTLSQV